ncbi:MAG: zinc ribbon domain-containing protein [Spirochaetaceae bacterium]|jgi:putative FmdB family regulatory protein|nr:zinc ribbon domain-containing protein [Spirochaetaceae bacterium]
MPTYEYECKSCGHTFDIFQGMSDEPLKDCPHCGKEVRRRINGGSGIIFKGSGFYVTDRKAGSGAASNAASASPQAGDSPAPKDSGGGGESSVPAKTAAAATPPAGKGESGHSVEKKAAG